MVKLKLSWRALWDFPPRGRFFETRTFSGIMTGADEEGGAMPTPEELKEEDRKIRQLRLVVNLTMSTISQTTLSLEEASKMVTATRELALRLFPGKELAFDLIYQPRFRRLLAERFRLH
jgi:hypothetical protein